MGPLGRSHPIGSELMRAYACAILLAIPTLLLGCSQNSAPTEAPPPVNPGSLTHVSGIIHGGQQPVTGSTVQLWQVGTTGYAAGAVALGSSVLSDGTGSFSLTGKYTCPSSSTLVYITATGGNPGSGVNANLSLMSALGACGNLTSSTYITINEVTTIASAYALAQFMSTSGNVGSYGYANQGLLNAFATVNNLVSTSTGTALATTPAGNGVVPQAEINTLANTLASCVNSTGGTAGDSSLCGNLFTAAKPPAGSAPTNTLTAALDIALNPANNVSTLFGYSSANAPFQPVLSSAPNDWTLALSYAGGGLHAQSIAIDAAGSVWVANYGDGTADGTAGLSKLSTTGAPASGSPFTLNLPNPYAVAIDQSGDAWVVNFTSDTIQEIATNGNTLAGPFTFPETRNPKASPSTAATTSGSSTPAAPPSPSSPATASTPRTSRPAAASPAAASTPPKASPSTNPATPGSPTLPAAPAPSPRSAPAAPPPAPSPAPASAPPSV